MDNNEIIIKVNNNRVFINPLLSIPIQCTSIPIEHMSFRSHEDIFWKVAMLGYKADVECLKVFVTDYKLKDTTGFEKQQPSKNIQKIFFEKFDWKKLDPLLTYFNKSKLEEYLYNFEDDSYAWEMEEPQQFEPKPSIATITETFKLDFNECHFMTGYVRFKRYIRKIEKELEFEISNEHILAEFDNVKLWFAKKLKTKKIKVLISIIVTNNEVTHATATSIHIDQITPELIDSVKYQRTFALTKLPRLTKPDKALFTAEEMFTQIDSEDIEGNVFNQSEDDILTFFIKESDIRNKKQLLYLADKKQSNNYKLRYTLNPNFGFLFLNEGAKNNHFVWELLNSNATYIWSINKEKENIDLHFRKIESIVNAIRTYGRENYKRDYRSNSHNNGVVFKVLKHKNIGSKSIDNFPDWKSRLNEQLT